MSDSEEEVVITKKTSTTLKEEKSSTKKNKSKDIEEEPEEMESNDVKESDNESENSEDSSTKKKKKKKKKEKSKEKHTTRIVRTKKSDDVDFSDSDNDVDETHRESRFGSKSGLKTEKIVSRSDDNELDELDDDSLHNKFFKNMYRSLGIVEDKQKPTEDDLKSLFTRVATLFLSSMQVLRNDLENEETTFSARAVDLFKLKTNFLNQDSSGNICVRIIKFPDSLENLNSLKLTEYRKGERETKTDYIVCMTSSNITEIFSKGSNLDKEEKMLIVKKIVYATVIKILEYCDEESIQKLVAKKGTIEIKHEPEENELLNTEFSDVDEEDSEALEILKFKQMVEDFNEHVRNHEPEDFNPEVEKCSGTAFEDIYNNLEERREVFKFYHQFVPCTIYHVSDADTFDLLCSFNVNTFASATIPNMKTKEKHEYCVATRCRASECEPEDKFIMLIRSRLMFFDAAETYTKPGAALAVAFEMLLPKIKEEKVHCYVSFRGAEPHGRELGELYINGRSVYKTLYKLGLKHKNLEGKLSKIVIKYDGKKKSPLANKFKHECGTHASAKNEYKETKSVRKLATKYHEILLEAFFGEDPDLKELGNKYNETL